MNPKSVFDISKFNVIEDQKSYYFFRALNNADNQDLISGIIIHNGEIERIRTDRERCEQERGTAAYNKDSKISLKEVWNHVKVRYSKETNCISLSSNTNISLDYGQSYQQQYIMVRVPKRENKKVYNAGQYMLEEIQKRIEQEITKLDEDSEISRLMKEIDSKETAAEIKKVVQGIFKKVKSEGKYIGANIQLSKKHSIKDRFSPKQYFSKQQQTDYNKIIAKLTVLEIYKILMSILDVTKDNTSLIETIGRSFSSGELIHYKDISKEEFIPISKEMMNILSLTQQLKEQDKHNHKIKEVQAKILKYINEGNKLEEKIPNYKISTNLRENSVSKMYSLTQGRIPNNKTVKILELIQRLTISRVKAIQYSDILSRIIKDNNYQDIIEQIKEKGIAIDNNIITKENNAGIKIAESVNIGLGTGSVVPIKEQKEIINQIRKINSKELLEKSIEEIQNSVLQKYMENC